MRVLIVAKTRRGSGACVGGITHEGRSVRLVSSDPHDAHAGLEYAVGEVWEIEDQPVLALTPPHVEEVIVLSAKRLPQRPDLETMIERFMPPVTGGPEKLLDGLLQTLPSGALYIAERTGIPSRSTQFWRPDRALKRDTEGKRIHYAYPTDRGPQRLAFVGFQDPVEVIPAGTLLRVSLAHWWHPRDHPEEELRCHGQLSGWILPAGQKDASAESTVSASPDAVAPSNDRPVDVARVRKVLKQTFGFAQFLPLQEQVVERLLARQDTLVIMPTGGGKSLCYQLPALLFDGLTVVVSPLIALMQDQVRQMQEVGVPAAFLNSTLSNHEYLAITRQVREGGIKMLYVAPETLLRPETLLLLERSRLVCFAVDEAHCISEWGHDFRPEYRQLQAVRERFPRAACVALTATATPRVREDIRRLLGIPAAGEFIASFDRANLSLAVVPRRDGLGQVLAFLEEHRGQSGIIYCSTRKQVDQLANELAARDWPALAYHAGMENEARRNNQEQFVRGDNTLMVATVAFGMGINKSNVRFVLHYNLPKDVESYYQEIGRSGRDGLPADCLLLHSRRDAVTNRRFIEEGAASEAPGRQARLDAMIRYAETAGCRRGPLLSYFGESHDGRCGNCDNCVEPKEKVERTDVTEAAQKFLSCVKRTGEIFGAGHVIDVLRGSQSERVLQRGHDRLSTYGVGKELSKEAWRDLAQQFIEQGLLEQDLQHGSLRLTSKAWAALKGEPVFARLQPMVTKAATTRADLPPHDTELFEALRRLRRELADAARLPAYIIFSDRTLVEMAALRPTTEAQLLNVSGVGQSKLEHYGAAFLSAIRDHGQSHPTPNSTGSPATSWLTGEQRRHEVVGKLFAAGKSLEDIAGQFGIKRGTVLKHLTTWHQAGNPLDAIRLLQASRVAEADRQRVFALFDELGCDRLGPVHEALGGSVAYDELHLLRLCRVSRQEATRGGGKL